MFLHDIGEMQLAQERLQALLDTDDNIIKRKWEHLAKSSLLKRYPLLFEQFYRQQGRIEEFYRRHDLTKSLPERIKRGLRDRIDQLSTMLRGRS